MSDGVDVGGAPDALAVIDGLADVAERHPDDPRLRDALDRALLLYEETRALDVLVEMDLIYWSRAYGDAG